MLDIDALRMDEKPRETQKSARASETRLTGLAGLAPRPRTIADTGLSESLLQELVAKHLHDAGILDLGELAGRSALAGSIVEELAGALRAEMLIEVKGPAPGTAGLRYVLTDRGRAFALQALARSGYIGPAPVPLSRYTEVVKAQSVHAHRVTRERMHTAFADTVIRAGLPRPARCGAALRPLDLRLRPARLRQELPLPAAAPAARRTSLYPLCHRGRRHRGPGLRPHRPQAFVGAARGLPQG